MPTEVKMIKYLTSYNQISSADRQIGGAGTYGTVRLSSTRMELNHSHDRSSDLPTALTTGYDRKLLPIDPTRLDERPPKLIRGGDVVFQRKARSPWDHEECAGIHERSQVRSLSRLSSREGQKRW
jgi:hypothetical protein